MVWTAAGVALNGNTNGYQDIVLSFILYLKKFIKKQTLIALILSTSLHVLWKHLMLSTHYVELNASIWNKWFFAGRYLQCLIRTSRFKIGEPFFKLALKTGWTYVKNVKQSMYLTVSQMSLPLGLIPHFYYNISMSAFHV